LTELTEFTELNFVNSVNSVKNIDLNPGMGQGRFSIQKGDWFPPIEMGGCYGKRV
jgi:hypothetical protein